MKFLVALRPNNIILIGYLKTRGGKGVQANPLNPLWIIHWVVSIIVKFDLMQNISFKTMDST